MKLPEAIIQILKDYGPSLTPQSIREFIKKDYSFLYNTDAQNRNVKKGHVKDLDHALLSQIYSTVRINKKFLSDTSSKPMKISLSDADTTSNLSERVSDKYLNALKLIEDWVTILDWATKVAEIYPDILEKAEKDAANQKSDTTGLREIAARISSNISQGIYAGKVIIDENQRPKKVKYAEELAWEHVLDAISEIDDRGINPDERSSTYDLIFNTKRYPPKLVYSLAHKYKDGKELDRTTFEGGENTQCFKDLRSLGFFIERKDFVNDLLRRFIQQAQAERDLTTKGYSNKYCNLDVKVGFGKGNFAKVPWISFTGYSQSVQSGIYPVYLYYKSINVLILAFGVSETNKPTLSWDNLTLKEKISDYMMREFHHMPERYGDSYVHSVYKLPLDFNSNNLTADLDKLIQEYANLMESNINSETISPTRELCLIGTAKSFHNQVDHVNNIIRDKGGWANWWSFVIDERVQEQLIKPFYLYLNAGHGAVKYRFLVSDYVTTRGNEGIETPWPEMTNANERGTKKLGDTQNLIFKTWFKTERVDEFDPPLKVEQFLPYKPFSNERNLINQNAFGYAYILDDVKPLITKNHPVVPDVEPILDPKAISHSFSEALKAAHVHFGNSHDARIRTFITSLMAKPLVILTGLSGSGKTQIAIRFGEWLGKERMHVAPVRPDWTGAEALFGYEDALRQAVNGRPAWSVPETLEFFLRAAADPYYPYLLVLDEMNLAHVERYFADVLSGMESGQACLPNLKKEADGCWRIPASSVEKIPFPTNIFIVGTVNVDETTYMFSPKVLDRANTFEFRVKQEDLADDYIKPIECEQGELGLIRGFLEIGQNNHWHRDNRFQGKTELAEQLRNIHGILSIHGFEFGHRVFYEAQRFAAIYAATGEENAAKILDFIIMQKLLPRLHGSRRRLEDLLRTLAEYCCLGSFSSNQETQSSIFEPEKYSATEAKLPISYDKIFRMLQSLRANQFTSFTE